MAKTPKAPVCVATLTHTEATRKNIPTAEYQSVPDEQTKNPIRVAYERRNKDLDPQLVWRGKDMQDWSDLVVHAPPLYIQEKIHLKVLIDDLKRFLPSPRAGEGQRFPPSPLAGEGSGERGNSARNARPSSSVPSSAPSPAPTWSKPRATPATPASTCSSPAPSTTTPTPANSPNSAASPCSRRA